MQESTVLGASPIPSVDLEALKGGLMAKIEANLPKKEDDLWKRGQAEIKKLQGEQEQVKDHIGEAKRSHKRGAGFSTRVGRPTKADLCLREASKKLAAAPAPEPKEAKYDEELQKLRGKEGQRKSLSQDHAHVKDELVRCQVSLAGAQKELAQAREDLKAMPGLEKQVQYLEAELKLSREKVCERNGGKPQSRRWKALWSGAKVGSLKAELQAMREELAKAEAQAEDNWVEGAEEMHQHMLATRDSCSSDMKDAETQCGDSESFANGFQEGKEMASREIYHLNTVIQLQLIEAQIASHYLQSPAGRELLAQAATEALIPGDFVFITSEGPGFHREGTQDMMGRITEDDGSDLPYLVELSNGDEARYKKSWVVKAMPGMPFGRIIEDDESDQPYAVQVSNGDGDWCKNTWVVKAMPGMTTAMTTPMGDQSPGLPPRAGGDTPLGMLGGETPASEETPSKRARVAHPQASSRRLVFDSDAGLDQKQL